MKTHDEESVHLLDEKHYSDTESDTDSSNSSFTSLSTISDLDLNTNSDHSFHLQSLVSLNLWNTNAQKLKTYLRALPWRLTLIRFAIFLLPSFVQHRFHSRTPLHHRVDKLGPTAYLDGLRGLAALFVFFCHYFYQSFIIAEGWGSAPHNYHVLKLPFLRLWYQGPPAVCVFFVISGYALSLKPLKLLRGRQFDEFAVTLSSLTFRRAIRLYLPTAISTFMIVVMLRLGIYEWTRDFASDETYLKNVREPHPERLGTTMEQLRDWGWSMFHFVQVFGWGNYDGSTLYDVHLWTIPVEFRCSLYLFLTLLGTARLRTPLRFLFLFGIMLFVYRHDHWELLLFYAGMFLAELDIIRGAHVPTPSLFPDEKQTTMRPRRWEGLFFGLLSILALYFMCQPDLLYDQTPGWVWLCSLIPEWWSVKYRFWQSVGAVLFVFCVARSPRWQRFFNLSIVQYFGRISYAIYLMHGPVMHTIGYTVERWAWGVTGVEGHWYNAGFMLGSLGCVPAVIWAADVFWRLIDVPTVRFAKWFEGWCSIRE